MEFTPNYQHFLDVVTNKRPARLPIYEHLISPGIMEKILNIRFADLAGGDDADVNEFFRQYCRFFRDMTYDVVSFEICITSFLPDNGAIMGGKPGPIQSRADFEKYPWDEIPRRFWAVAEKQFRALVEALPPGMKAVGGIGNGVFEISEDLVGFEYLAYMMAEDPLLFGDIYKKTGDLMTTIWEEFLARHCDGFVACRFGDDLGFKTSTLLAPATIRGHIIPQYRRVVNLVHRAGFPFLWHSCGNIFEIMDDVIAIGIDAKHSNEDAIAPFDVWINRYNDSIGFLGGIDLDVLCLDKPEVVFEKVVSQGRKFRNMAKGFALGSGNSIPDYVPVQGYLAMIEAAQKIRETDAAGSAGR
ncbi:MAG: uroporphyrinogen decarboxylase family protein [Candidatus Zhuqueibacterota bacterium]